MSNRFRVSIRTTGNVSTRGYHSTKCVHYVSSASIIRYNESECEPVNQALALHGF